MTRSFPFILVAVAMSFCTLPVRATGPEYKSYRDWVLENNPDAKAPEEKRIFVGYSNEWSTILSHEKDLDIRKLLDQTKAKGTKVGIIILRSGENKAAFQAVVGPEDKPVFELRPLDVICLSEPMATQ